MKNRIYLDNNAATPVDPLVIEAVTRYLNDHTGNPSSVHRFGKECRKFLTASRDLISEYFRVRPEEIVFNSGGTEGANYLLRGWFHEALKGHIITSTVEHPCVHETIQELEASGVAVTYLEPGAWGAVKPEAVREAIRPDTKLIVLMAVNNETGVRTDLEEIGKIAVQQGIHFFVDGVALLGKEPLHIPEGVSAMFFSGQKIHGLQGSGFCYVKRGVKLHSLITGGGQQNNRRSGTENMPGIVGLGKAIELIRDGLPAASDQMRKLRDDFEERIFKAIPGTKINGEGPRVSNTSNLYVPGIDGESLITSLDMEGIAVAHGSACASGSLEPSRVLLSMGLPLDRVNSSIRVSFSRMNTQEEVVAVVEAIKNKGQ